METDEHDPNEVDVDGEYKPHQPRHGSMERPFDWFALGGVDWWQGKRERFDPLAEIEIVQVPCVVTVNLSPMPKGRRVHVPSEHVMFRFPAVGRYVVPREVARAMCIVDPISGVVKGGLSPVQARPVDAVTAPLHPMFLDSAAQRRANGRARK